MIMPSPSLLKPEIAEMLGVFKKSILNHMLQVKLVKAFKVFKCMVVTSTQKTFTENSNRITAEQLFIEKKNPKRFYNTFLCFRNVEVYATHLFRIVMNMNSVTCFFFLSFFNCYADKLYPTRLFSCRTHSNLTRPNLLLDNYRSCKV